MSITNAGASDARAYRFRTVYACSSETSLATSLTVSSGLLNITQQPVAQVICSGDGVSFSISTSGTGPATYQWRRNGVAIAGATGATYSIPSISASDFASYSCVATNPCGSVTSSSASLSPGTIPSIGLQPTGQSTCAGGSVSFTVGASGSSSLRYQWQRNGTNISGATSATYSIPSVLATDGGNYGCVVINGCGSVTSNSATLTVTPPLTILQHPINAKVCTGGSATFAVSASGNGLSYQWRRNGATIAGATASSYLAALAGMYDCVVTGTCGSTTSSAAMLEVNSPTAIVGQPIGGTACTGTPFVFTVGASGKSLTYQWRRNGSDIPGANGQTFTISSPSVADVGTYNVVVGGECGTVTSNTVSLALLNSVAITTNPVGASVCPGDAVTFGVTATGSSPSYQWRKDGTPISGATGSIYSVASVSPSDFGSYSCVVSNACGNATSTAAVLSVGTNPLISAQPISQTACVGGGATFTIGATGSASFSYQWRKSGVAISPLANPSAATPTLTLTNVQAADFTSYDCIVTNGCGSTTSTTAALNLSCQPFGSAGPMDNATSPGNRPDPGPMGPPTTWIFQSLTVPSGGFFGLGSNETLNLNNGMGTLYINTGATFYGNGTILGNVLNSGLFIIPITRTGIISSTRGGVVRIAPPPPPAPGPTPPPPVAINPPGPVQVTPGTLVQIGGSGFAGTNGGSAGGGTPYPGSYVITTPAVTTQGTASWDGRLDVTGTFTQTPSGVLRMFIAGNQQGVTYSFLNVGMSASIDGALQIVLEPSLFRYLPSVGDSFDIVTAAGGLTLPASGITVTSLMSADGASQLGLSLPRFQSGFAADPNQLVSISPNIFSYSVVNGGRTLRITLTQPVCPTRFTELPAGTAQCAVGMAQFNVWLGGSGPLTYQWQIESTPPGSGVFTNMSNGPVAGSTATASGVTSSTLLIDVNQDLGLTRRAFRCVATNACDTIMSTPALLWISTGGLRWQAASAGPPARRLHAMAYDSVRRRAVLFGGRDVSNRALGDTWERDAAGNWTLMTPTTSIPARADHAMAFVRDLAVTLCFGGYDATGTLTNNLFAWDGAAWTPFGNGSIRPSARGSHAMAYDASRRQLILFGGYDTQGLLADTWILDTSTGTWSQHPTSSPHPSPRLGHMMAFDAARNVVVLFGGGSSNLAFGDTWEWNGTGWHQVSAGGTAGPIARSYGIFAYDMFRQRVILHGGFPGGPTLVSDTWGWDGASWQPIAATAPPARRLSSGAYDEARGEVLLFGGLGPSGNLADTWELPPAAICCLADFDGGNFSGVPDGGVTIDDLLFYLIVFEAGDIRADVDDGSFTGTPDDGVTIDDLLYYLSRFEAGC